MGPGKARWELRHERSAGKHANKPNGSREPHQTTPSLTMKKIRILLCDDHNIVRAGLKCLLETSDEVEVVGEAANGHECVREAKRLRPDVVLLDLAMPLLNGMEAARRISKNLARTRV